MPRSAPVTVRAFAKINLDLRILGRLPDSYHDVRTVLQSVRLHDTLTFTPTRGQFVIECDVPGMPLDARNLVWKAAALLDHVVRRRGCALPANTFRSPNPVCGIACGMNRRYGPLPVKRTTD